MNMIGNTEETTVHGTGGMMDHSEGLRRQRLSTLEIHKGQVMDTEIITSPLTVSMITGMKEEPRLGVNTDRETRWILVTRKSKIIGQ